MPIPSNKIHAKGKKIFTTDNLIIINLSNNNKKQLRFSSWPHVPNQSLMINIWTSFHHVLQKLFRNFVYLF